jgi:hypothetical protein
MVLVQVGLAVGDSSVVASTAVALLRRAGLSPVMGTGLGLPSLLAAVWLWEPVSSMGGDTWWRNAW